MNEYIMVMYIAQRKENLRYKSMMNPRGKFIQINAIEILNAY